MKNRLKDITPKLIGSYILRGVFIVAPLYLTGYALFKLFLLIDSPIQEIYNSLFETEIHGLGLLTTIFILIVAGYLGTTLLMDNIFKQLEKLIFKIPLVKEIYKSLRDIIGAFVSDKKKFEKPVLVEVYTGIYRIGFITNESLERMGIVDLVSVYFPLSYAFTGELLFVERAKLKPLKTDQVGDLMKFVISGGIVDNNESK